MRTEKHLTQAELAQQCGVLERTISYWECGERECDLTMVIILANIFGCTTDYLLGKTDF
ncbi:MAG: helix-turn-helix transcriptional regulator [Clostridia bacterium]|nr:helix-turn-helix transcriptional regulator [Clostridia bacterium]